MSEVLCWTWALDDGRDTRSLAEVLSAQERTRAAAFARSCDRDAYVIAHAGLRVVLGSYLGRAPTELQFAVGPQGKPSLLDAGRCAFNLAHTRHFAICAVARAEVGVDIERLAGLADVDGLLPQICTPKEIQAMHALDAGLRESAFYRLWVRKEALLKACGAGLLGAPTSRHVGVQDWPDGEWQDLGPATIATQRWFARHVPAPAHHLAAVVVAADPGSSPACRALRLPSDWTAGQALSIET